MNLLPPIVSTILYIAMMIFQVYFRGLLTGKYKKQNGKISATTGRLSYASNVGYKSTQSCPALSSYENDESYWNLMATLEKISRNHGNIYIIVFNVIKQISLTYFFQYFEILFDLE